MSEQSPLARQWPLLQLLCARHYGVTLREMAREMGVSEKTIRRDLHLFRDLGFPLDEIAESHGRKAWRMQADGQHPALSFPFDEAIALYLARRFLEPLAGTPFWTAAHRAFRKIRSSLGKSALDYLQRMAGRLHQTPAGASDYTCKGEVIDQLMLGVEDSRAVFITYHSARSTEPLTYDIHPYGMTFFRGWLYVVGFSCQHETIRHWKVDRMIKAEVTPVPFARPVDFDLAEHFRGSWGIWGGREEVRVRVRFSPAVARYVSEKQWHPTQELEPQPDGSLIAAFQLTATLEIKSWVLSFGPEAEVLEPEELREEILADCERVLTTYQEARSSIKPLPDNAFRHQRN